MRPLLILTALLLPASLLHAQSNMPGRGSQQVQLPPSTRIGTQQAEKAPLSKEQQAKQDALEKANPGLKEAIKNFEARGGKINSWGNTDEAGMAAAGAKPAKPATGGNKKAADSAYKRKDYAAAAQQYKALAAEGDPEAALILGIMHQKGQGVDKDPAAAYAWYGRAAQQGHPAAREIVRDMNDKDQMEDSDIEAAGRKYEEIAQELDGPETAQSAAQQFQTIKEETNINAELYERASGREESPSR
jgi:TPR repeat protein